MGVEVLETVTKTIGSLALAYPYLRRLGVAETIASQIRRGTERQVATGHVIEVLVLNRLSLRPSPISKMSEWVQTQAIEEVSGLSAEALNDDRIGRALDEIHPHLNELWATIVLAGTQAYGVRLDQLHSDVTRIAFEGAYDEVATETADGQALARIVHGYTGKQDASRKQVTLSVTVTADGALPLWYRVADGNAADPQTYLPHLAALRTHLGVDRPLIVGDSKLITRPNLLGFCRVGARCLGPTGLTDTDRAVLQAHWRTGQPLERLDPSDDPTVASRYSGLEHSEQLVDPDDGTIYLLRRLIVRSVADRQATRHQRAKDVARARRDLHTIRRRLGHPCYRDPAFVQRKVTQALTKVKAFVQANLQKTDRGWELVWHLDRSPLRTLAQYDGFSTLVTNWDTSSATPIDVLAAYKDQIPIEGRFRVIKHPPLQVRPLWLHQPRRIESLLFVVLVALFLFALIEREARRVVQQTGQVFTGLRPDRRDHLPVTATRLFEVFGSLALVKQRLRWGSEVVDLLVPTTLTLLQNLILQRLGLSPPDLYLHSHSTRLEGCGK